MFAIGTVDTLAFAIGKPRKYLSESQILYREGIRSSDITAGESFGDPTRKLAMRLQEMVLSRTRLQKIIDEFKLYPGIVENYRETFARVRGIEADVFLPNHDTFFDLAAKRDRQRAGDANAFVDAGALERFNAELEANFEAELARQTSAN